MMNDGQIPRLFWAMRAALVAILLYVAVAAVITPSPLDVGIKPKAVSGDEYRSDAPPMATEIVSLLAL